MAINDAAKFFKENSDHYIDRYSNPAMRNLNLGLLKLVEELHSEIQRLHKEIANLSRQVFRDR
jgi:hypothetical protein